MGGKTSTSTSTTQIPAEVLARYNSVNSQAQTVAATPFQQYSSNPSSFVAPLTSTQQAGITNTNNFAGAAQPYMQAAAGLTMAGTQSADPSQIGAGQINQFMSPYLGDVMSSTAALQNQQNQQQQSGQLGTAITSGAFGGDRAGISAANLAQQQQLANSSTLANIANTGFNTALGAAQQQQGVNLQAQQADLSRLQAGGAQLANVGTAAQTAGLAGAQAQMTAGQAEQQTNQAGDTALYNQFLQQQSYPFQTAQFLANIAEGTGSLSGSTTTSTQPQPFFSDERLKENIKEIGRTHDGQIIARFNYKGDPRTTIGLLAQDVEKHHPHAVGLAGGFKTVDYAKATDKAAALGAARHHFAGGGLADDSQQGYTPGLLPGAGSYADPSASGYVPQTPQNRRQLMVSRFPQGSPQSGLGQIAQLAQSGKNVGDDITSMNHFVQGLKSPLSWFGNTPDNTTPNNTSDKTTAYRGGLIRHRDAGGGIDDEQMPDSDGGLGAMARSQNSAANDKLSIPNTQSSHSLPSSGGTPGSSSGSGLAGLGTAASGIANLLELFANRGGLITREHHAGGNSVGDPAAADPAAGDQALQDYQATQAQRDQNFLGTHPMDWNSSTDRLVHDTYNNPLFSYPFASETEKANVGMKGRGLAGGTDAAANDFAKKQDEAASDAAKAPASPANAPASPAGGLQPTAKAPASPANAPASPAGGLQPTAPAQETQPTQQSSEGLAGASRPNPNVAVSAGNGIQNYENVGEGGMFPGFSKFLKDNQHLWVPLAAGFGTMASSNSRYLGSAILQGIGGAATAYQGTLNNEAQRNAETANTGLTDVGRVQGEQNLTKGKVFQSSAGLATAPTGANATVFGSNTPLGSGSNSGLPGDASVGASGVTGANVNAAGVNGGPVAAPGAKNPAFPLLGPAAMARVREDISPGSQGFINPAAMGANNDAVVKNLEGASTSAQNIQRLNIELAHALINNPKWNAGPIDEQTYRQALAQVAGNMGISLQGATNSGEMIDKLAGQISTQTTGNAHDTVQGLVTSLKSLPSRSNSHSGALDLIANNIAQTYTPIEQYKYANQALDLSATGPDNSKLATGYRRNYVNVGRLVAESYAKDHGNDQLARTAAIQKLLKERPTAIDQNGNAITSNRTKFEALTDPSLPANISSRPEMLGDDPYNVGDILRNGRSQ